MLDPKKNSMAEKKQSTRLLWLIMELSRYDVTTQWRAGKWIPHADALSRILKVGNIISLTTKPVFNSLPHVYDATSCDRISLVCGETPYTRQGQLDSQINGDAAERAWLADTSDSEGAVQSVAANPELWHVVKKAIVDHIKGSENPPEGKDDELYLSYIQNAMEGIQMATRCRSRGQTGCSESEWERYLQIAEAIGINPKEQSDTLTPF